MAIKGLRPAGTHRPFGRVQSRNPYTAGATVGTRINDPQKKSVRSSANVPLWRRHFWRPSGVKPDVLYTVPTRIPVFREQSGAFRVRFFERDRCFTEKNFRNDFRETR